MNLPVTTSPTRRPTRASNSPSLPASPFSCLDEVLLGTTETLAVEFGADLCLVAFLDHQMENVQAFSWRGKATRVEQRASAITTPDFTIPQFVSSNTVVTQHRPKRGQGFRSSLEILLETGQEAIGVVRLYAYRAGWFDLISTTHRRMVGRLVGTSIALAREHERVQQLAFVDERTQLFSANYYAVRLTEAIAAARRYKHPLSVIAYDSDALKQANELHSYVAGTAVIVQPAFAIRKHLRAADVPARWGGDEVTIIAPQTDLREAQHLARHLQTIVAAMTIVIPPENTKTGIEARIQPSISVGAATLEAGDDGQSLTARALRDVQQDKQERRAQR